MSAKRRAKVARRRRMMTALPGEIFAETGFWEAGLLGALSVNSGMDACVGLYDDYYDLYFLMGQIEDYPDPSGDGSVIGRFMRTK